MTRRENVKVAFQGERGAYSEEAIYSFFSSDVVVKPCKSLYDTFEAVVNKAVNFAVVPVENSLEGSVNETFDILSTSFLKVCGEINLRIRHALIARPSTEVKNIKIVYSHPQALAQCRLYLRRLDVKSIATYDTAGSVKIVKRKNSSKMAAIASIRSASIYDMKVLDSGIEDSPNNYTRFFVLSYKDNPRTGNDKTSIIFSSKHVPGALYKTLKEFAERDINLTKIESRPTREKPWEYNFYLDFEGHRKDDKCIEVLDFLEKKGLLLKVLGSYPKAMT